MLDIRQALTAPVPPSDPMEPNDDVDQVKPGALFTDGQPALTTRAKPSIRIAGSLDVTEDPRDLYRIWVPAHRVVHVSVAAAGGGLAGVALAGVTRAAGRPLADYMQEKLAEPLGFGNPGDELERALAHWGIAVRGRVCVDVGASTGGFTDCLLQQGAARVIAIDTGYGQMNFRLRQDSRVRLLEKTNARYLKPEDLGEAADLIAMDVSFISATQVLPAVVEAVRRLRSAMQGVEAVVLVKPQFEAGRAQVGKGGIVRDHAAQTAAVDKVRRALAALGAELGLVLVWLCGWPILVIGIASVAAGYFYTAAPVSLASACRFGE